jgi:RNA polymerase sigma-70 factor (ECF subfamily)
LSLFLDHPELLRGFRAGDAAVLERTYYTYVNLVSAVVGRHARWTDGSPSPDRADVVQDVFIRAFQERARLAYDGLRPYRPLLLTITRNLIVDWARKNGREQPQAFEDEVSADSAEPVDPLLLARVDAFVATLDGPLRGVYEQRYVHDASQEDAARALGLSRQQIRTLEQRLRDDLARAIEK